MTTFSTTTTVASVCADRARADWPQLRVHECFERVADRQPDAPAILHDGATVLYADLERRANALAHALLHLGVASEEPVGVLTERSAALPVAFLAILKAGGAYVPMGADLPAQRLANMASQARMRVLVALDGLQPPAELCAALAVNSEDGSLHLVRPEELSADALACAGKRPNRPGGSSDLAAILFTSGSTGQPKGVMLQHDACVNMAYGHLQAHGVSHRDRVLLSTAPGFILGFRELCLPLLAGAAFVPVGRALLDEPEALLREMSRWRVSVAMFTPSYLHLLGGRTSQGLRCLLTAGERPNADDARTYARKLEYWNIHGATEVCGTICMQRVDPDGQGPLASGRPFTNMAVYLLDGDGNEVAPGEVGEIHVTGVSLARGYLQQPELAAQRFVETPRGRAYRTGDMGRWNEAGLLETLGRANDVVKVSGQAVALGEIEQTLLRRPGVRYAAAMQHAGRLIAFVELTDTEMPPFAEWHEFLGKTLPGYMLPAQVTRLARMPVSSHGKVDRQALATLAALAASEEDAARAAGEDAPRGEAETRIAAVWQTALGAGTVRRDDNFYALGGTSLLAIAVSQRLHGLGYAVSAQDILAAGTVAALAERAIPTSGPNRIATGQEEAQGVATAGQEDFWIGWKLGLATTGAQITRILSVLGEVPPVERWQQAWSQLIARHAALRTAFFEDVNGKIHWRTVSPGEVESQLRLIRDECETLHEARERIEAHCNPAFDLTQPPLARAGLVNVAEGGGETLFWFTVHHGIVDGLSARVLQEELHSLLAGVGLQPAPDGLSAAEQAERKYLESGAAARDQAYWREKLDSLPAEAFADFRTDYRRPANPSGAASEPLVERLSGAEAAALARLARSRQAGLHALLLALLGVEARRRDGRRTVIAGTGISMRPPGAEQAVGLFVNLLPMVLTGEEQTPFAEQISTAQATLTGMVEHGGYPTGRIYREYRERHVESREQGRNALWSVGLTAAPSRRTGDGASGPRLTPRQLPGRTVHASAGLDLDFSYEPLTDDGGGLELTLAWNPEVYSRHTAEAWLRSLADWARYLAADAERANVPLPSLLPAEAQCLARWEQGPMRQRPAQRFHEIFEGLVDRQPGSAAVVTRSGNQSYAELDRKANLIAWALLERGVAHEEPVAVLTECSPDLPAAAIGIWKAGATYLPLALELPPARLAFLARDSGARFLLVLDGHPIPETLATVFDEILRLEELKPDSRADRPQVAGAAQDLAAIIYTSGSTGMPKGVLLQHDGIINAGYASKELFSLKQTDRFSLVATPGFDASLWELCSLLHGLALVPISRALRDDPWAMKRYYTEMGVTVAFHVPSWLRISKQLPFQGLRVLLIGGEAGTHEDVRCYGGNLDLFHAYGPTETSIFVCAELIRPEPNPTRVLPVGPPMANSRIMIRRDGSNVPPGVVGEVWLGGVGLSRGYLNNPELTAQRFVETPEGRFYKSGDLGRWDAEGRLVLEGRIDHQIKLHGQRLELGEIEQALRAQAGVEEATVVVETLEGGTQSLWAFVRLRSGMTMPADEQWREALAQDLPRYMLPAGVFSVASMPLTPSGKVDRESLLQTARQRSRESMRTPPASEWERRIAACWQDLLGASVSREDNFFALGGNSLLAVTLAHRLSQELGYAVPARELFASPTLAGFAHRLANLQSATPAGAGTNQVSDLATEGQREFWVAERAGLDTRTFTIPLLRVVGSGAPPVAVWDASWAKLIARHEALRTSFQEDAQGQLRRAAVSVLECRLETATQPDMAAARAYARQRQSEPLRMDTAPLWRAGLIELENTGEVLFWLALHHSVGDGLSVGILVDELGTLLDGGELPPLTGSFALTAQREGDYLASDASDKDARYWSELLAGLPEAAFDEPALDSPRSIDDSGGNHRFQTRLSASVGEALKDLARAHQASLHAVFLTLLALEARRRGGHPEALVGTAAMVREFADEARVVGFYVNMLPVKCHVPSRSSFSAALRATQQALAEGLQHARYPFSRMYRDFWNTRPMQRHPARYPLFDLAVTENPESRPDARGVSLRRDLSGSAPGEITYEYTAAAPGQDVVLIHESGADGELVIQCHVDASVYTRETAGNWFRSITAWAEWLAEDCHRAEQPLPTLLPHEVAALAEWEWGAEVPRPALRFHELLEQLLDDDSGLGSRPAVVTESNIITYQELEEEANAIAHRLRADGVNPGSVVAVLTERSANLPASVLGIWKAGGIYLPLAADLPGDRLLFMARDAAAGHLIVLDGLAVPPALGGQLPIPLRPEDLTRAFRQQHTHRPSPAGAGGEAAYIVYTSGSTGRPKGALIGHSAYVNTVLGAAEMLGLRREDRSLMFASPSFDVSLSDIGMPLARGASLCPVPFEVLTSPQRFRAFLSRMQVTVADITPTYLRLFEGAELPGLRILVTGGEPPFPADIENYAGRLEYFNAYGPTENAISSTMGRLTPDAPLTCGRPLPNTSVHVCDADGEPLPPGVAGEIRLGGAGLALGYVGRPELTQAAFVESGRGRQYRTGDWGRWRASGEIEILGRADDQVKLNGIRVELGEIEQALASHPCISQAVVLLESEARARHTLHAFVRPVSGREAPSESAWREYLASRLPTYMIPSRVIEVGEFPLSNSGKVDKRALAALLPERAPRNDAPPPEPGLETEIAHAWSELLHCEGIGREDNFFALGGHSLQAISLSHRLETSLGFPVPARELFANPVLRGFARRVADLSQAQQISAVRSDRATEGQREFWTAELAGLDTRVFNMPLILAGPDAGLPDKQLREALAALVRRHGALRTGFQQDADGPLRRFTLPEILAELESSEQPDLTSAHAHVRQRQREPLLMNHAPLWRAGVVRITASNQALVWIVLHHAVADGVSLGVITEELGQLLAGVELPSASGDFDMEAGREECYLASPACAEDAEYWRQVLTTLGGPDAHAPFEDWPLDLARPAGRTARHLRGAHAFEVQLDSGTAGRLRDFARRQGATLHGLLLTLMAHEVRRRSGRANFVLGTAASTRDSASDARVVGYYVNLLPVACRHQPGVSFEQALRTVQAALADGLQHARYPFARIHGDLRSELELNPHPARYPLFDFAVMENPGVEKPAAGGLGPLPSGAGQYELRANAPAQDMVLVHEAQPGGGLSLHWYANAAIYEKETAETWIDSLVEWARLLVSSQRQPDTPLPALLPAETARLAEWECGPTLVPDTASLPERFEQWARREPARAAVVTEDGALSFELVNARANALAHALQAAGACRQQPVGVLTGRSLALPETALAIWKSGACFLPLYSELPADRLRFIAEDAGVRVLIALDSLQPPAPLLELGCAILRPESLTAEFLATHSHAVALKGGGPGGADAACIYYTSGSTGVPKGVLIQHHGLNNLGAAISLAHAVRPEDRFSLLASPAFDAWISDVVEAWFSGASLVPIVSGEIDDIAGISAKFARLGVTHATMTPSYLRLFEQAEFPGLRVLMTVGEPPHPPDALHYAARLRYFNGYGPTENTAATAVGLIRADARRLTSGRPLANVSIHIQDETGAPVPPGSVGHIGVAGESLAAGYLNRPGLTAASFVETPSGRRYLTGDLGRWTLSGELEILGRRDSQVKLHGQRVELGEVEHRIEMQPGVRQAASLVEVRADGSQLLWAFAVLNPGVPEPGQAAWHEALAASLPVYMVPAAVIGVPAIPINSSGKVDRAALLRLASQYAATSADSGSHGDMPRQGKEQRIAEIWQQHLECATLTRQDNFFDLGGNSLRAIAVVNRLRREFHCTVNDLYEHPRLAEFAGICRERPERLRTLIHSAATHWREYIHHLAAYGAEREAALELAEREYEARNRSYRRPGSGHSREYGHVLLTGATGYLGSYLLRELLADGCRQVTVLVRGSDGVSSRARLHGVLSHYFGADAGASMSQDRRLTVLAGDLRRADLGLSSGANEALGDGLNAVFHCAANVKHFGHYGEFHADNVAATGHLMKLASRRAADFHLISTLSVCGRAPETGFRLFTEYDAPPGCLDENYYVRSKQEAERLVIAARADLPNACIHRTGNLVYPAAGGPLQHNIEENAFFRQVAAFLQLGVAPDDAHLWLCHVDLVAAGIVRLALSAGLTHVTHHLENSRRDSLAGFVAAHGQARSCAFDEFLERLAQSVDDPGLEASVTATLENFGLYRGVAPQPQARRLEIVSRRTQLLLKRLGVVWPPGPPEGQALLLDRAAGHFAPHPSTTEAAPC